MLSDEDRFMVMTTPQRDTFLRLRPAGLAWEEAVARDEQAAVDAAAEILTAGGARPTFDGGAYVAFDPLRHFCGDGDVREGDLCRIVHRGWDLPVAGWMFFAEPASPRLPDGSQLTRMPPYPGNLARDRVMRVGPMNAETIRSIFGTKEN